MIHRQSQERSWLFKNHSVIQFCSAVLLSSSTEMSQMIICSFFNPPDEFKTLYQNALTDFWIHLRHELVEDKSVKVYKMFRALFG